VLGKPTTGAGPPHLRLNPHRLWQTINLGDRYAITAETSFHFPSRFGGFRPYSGKALNSCNSVAGPIFTRGLCGKNSTDLHLKDLHWLAQERKPYHR
jgi:hypothetical protein